MEALFGDHFYGTRFPPSRVPGPTRHSVPGGPLVPLMNDGTFLLPFRSVAVP